MNRWVLGIVAAIILSLNDISCTGPEALLPLVCAEDGEICLGGEECCSGQCLACHEVPLGVCVPVDDAGSL